MPDFLLELRSEEIPARMQAGARAALENLFLSETSIRGLHVSEPETQHAAITVWSTPRRLVLIARGLPDATSTVAEEIKGPKTSAPPQALEGFLRKTGLTQEQLTERDGIYFAISEKPGRATKGVLAEAIPAMIRAFPWPKSQRWGAASISTESPRWVRPLSGIVAILGEDLVQCTVGDVTSSYATRGHRFHAPGEITIGGAHDYAEKLRLAHVIVDHEERQNLIRSGAAKVAADAGLVLVEDEGLVIENAGLTEWPVPLLGRFDADYLEVPPEVIQLTARTNQKYFICRDAVGKLANAFVCTANIAATDGGAGIVDGNRKVLAARLSDARFFWQQDRKIPLDHQAERLARITFHDRLGSLSSRVNRLAELSRDIVTIPAFPVPDSFLPDRGLEQKRPAFAQLAVNIGHIVKADLVTEMVGEFPELQGIMGAYYAAADGKEEQAVDAIRDHYKPVSQSDVVPTAPLTVAISLADKLDTLAAFFEIDEKPTGSKDPFALRRAALGVIALITVNNLRIPLLELMTQHLVRVRESAGHNAIAMINRVGFAAQWPKTAFDLLDFLADRLKVQQREAGVRHDLIDAVFALGGEDDLVRLLARVHALQAFVATPDGLNLLAGYKRAANILKKEGFTAPLLFRGGAGGGVSPLDATLASGDRPHPNPSPEEEGLKESAEAALISALDSAEPRAASAIDAEDFTTAMAALATLRGPIDAFFESVIVNDADPAKRAARFGLLNRFVVAVHKVADFSRIES